MLPAGAPVRNDVRLWVDGLLAGRYFRAADGAAQPAAVAGDGGPLVLWASQTGNAEEFAGRVAERLEGAQLVNMNDVTLPDLAAARDVLIVTSTFGDGGPPDNGADFWDRLARQRRTGASPACATRCSASATGPTTTSAVTPSRSTRGWPTSGRSKMLDRADCEAYDDEPMHEWADAVSRCCPTRAPRRPQAAASAPSPAPPPSPNRSPAPSPVLAPLSRNVGADTVPPRRKRCASSALTSPSTTSTYSAGDSLGVFAAQRPRDRRRMARCHRSARRDDGRGRRRRATPCATR